MSRYVRIVTVGFPERVIRAASDKRAAVFEHLRQAREQVGQHHPDLVVFCEGVESLAQTVDQAETLDKPAELLEFYQQVAIQHKCTVAGSVKRRDEKDCVYNSLVYYSPQGEVLGHYDKTFLTDGEIELGLTSGKGAMVVDTPAGKLGGVICFDLNFDQLRLEYEKLQPDILTFASMYHGGLMQQIWAYKSRSFFAAALNMPTGGGEILNPQGCKIAAMNEYSAPFTAATINLDRVMIHLNHNREKFADIRGKYGAAVELDIPPGIGTAIVYSHSEKFSASDIVKEFDLELVDDFFRRSVSQNKNNCAG